ncbi:Chromatin modification-related protein [[Candida] zeylanoides]
MDLPTRQKSQRLLERASKTRQFELYRQKARNVTTANELLPGLNDISDAFEALPPDLIKYFTLLKEIDAKCINTVPLINRSIEGYIAGLHGPGDGVPGGKRLAAIRTRLLDVIPCLEEKMHVTSVATDVLHKHLYRINNDFKLIINNNEVPESIRIGPLNHPAMIMDSSGPSDLHNPNRSAQSQRSESRREALAARKHKDDDDDEAPKRKRAKESTPDGRPAASATGPGPVAKKRQRRDADESPRPEADTRDKAGDRKRKPKREEAYIAVEVTTRGPPSHPGHQGTQPETGANEPTYCYCNQVSFGEMVGCDGDDCKREWFHLPCIGFKNPPKGKWYCDDCVAKMKKKRV